MEIAITAIGTATPRFKRSQLEIAELISSSLNLNRQNKRLLHTVYHASGIDYRYSVLSDFMEEKNALMFFSKDPNAPLPSTSARMQIYKDNALPLALEAIENCCQCKDAFDKTEITHLITVSCTGMYAPGIDIEIVQSLKLKSNTARTCVNFMGCYGAFNAIKLANSICKADTKAKVLIVCVELCTIHFQNSQHKDNLISNAIFADGAAAIIIESNMSDNKCFVLQDFYCDLVPQTKKEMAWTIVDSGFDIVLSTYVPEIIQSGISTFAKKLLARYQLELPNIDFFAIHPGGIKILQACEQALKIDKTQNKYAYSILKNFGNMSSATILFVLELLWNDIRRDDHEKNIFSCAFGPGLTLESMLMKAYYV